jgi:hypothetical protein
MSKTVEITLIYHRHKPIDLIYNNSTFIVLFSPACLAYHFLKMAFLIRLEKCREKYNIHNVK